MSLDLTQCQEGSFFFRSVLDPLSTFPDHSISAWAGIRALEIIEREEWISFDLEQLLRWVADSSFSSLPDWDGLTKGQVLALIQAGVWKGLEESPICWEVKPRSQGSPITPSNLAIRNLKSRISFADLSHWRSQESANRLLVSLKEHKVELQGLWDRMDRRHEDGIYRFYHSSFKVFGLQGATQEIVAALEATFPERRLNADFRRIIREGTGKHFETATNQDWHRHTRPIVEAYFHARYFLEMVIKYADLDEAPTMMPCGWAAVLYLYDMR